MKCRNQHCVNGLEPVQILDSRLSEIALLSANERTARLPIHTHTEMWPCRYCNPRQYERFKRNKEDAAQRAMEGA